MNPTRRLARTALVLALAPALLPLAAQTPLFNDGTQFGGSRVFSEGLNPLANPARFDQSPAGWYVAYVDGDQRAKDNKTLLQDAMGSDPAAVGAALAKLKDAPWALRTRAYALAGVKEGVSVGFSREEFNSIYAVPDLDPLHLGDATRLLLNTSLADGRRAVVNRIHVGGGSLSGGTSAGMNLRLEQWQLGWYSPYFTQPDGSRQTYLPETAVFPFTPVDDPIMNYRSTQVKSINWAVDLGFTTELAQGLRLGAMVDQLNAKRMWDVQLKPQYRAALQLDLSPVTTLTVESDINATARMPIPVKQQASAASLRYQVSPAVLLKLGAERRKYDASDVTRFGATLQLRTSSFLLSVGFQAGQDRPMKGLSLKVD